MQLYICRIKGHETKLLNHSNSYCYQGCYRIHAKKEEKTSYVYYTTVSVCNVYTVLWIHKFRTMLLSKGSCKSLFPQKLENLNDGRPCGERVLSFQPHLQHPHEALVSVKLAVCSNGLQSGHGQLEVDANGFPLVSHFVVEGIHQFLQSWSACGSCGYVHV